MDDKAKIPVGETGTPEAATSHQRRVFSKCNIDLEASDHNYHSVNLTPSVILNCQIPDSPNSSFYTGQVFVGIKDSVFEGSDPVRHMIELLDVLRSEHNEFPSYLSIFTDGGADLNIIFLYTQCVLWPFFWLQFRCAQCREMCTQSKLYKTGRTMHVTSKYWSIWFGVRKWTCRCIRKNNFVM